MMTFRSDELKQRSPEWYEARKGLVTASNVGAILGLDPNRGPDDVLRAMVREYHGYEREFKGNVATEYGAMHEAGAISEYEIETGKSVQECGFFVCPDYPWLGASPDGLIDDDGLIEVKCPYGKRDGGEFKTLDEQPHYHAQIMVELLATGRKWCHFWQWSPHDNALEVVEESDNWYSMYLPELKAFHDRFLSEVDNTDHLEPKRKEIDNERARKLLAEYDEVRDQADFAAQRKKEIMNELISMAKERDAVVCGRKLTRVEKAGSVSYAKVVKKYAPDVDLEPFRGKPSVSWRLT